MPGFRREGLFLKDALQRIGVEAEVFAVSPYKAAGEALVRNEYSAENREQLERFLSKPSVRLAAVTSETAWRYAEIDVHLVNRGKPIPRNDVWIAASAMEHGCTLLTLNPHFREIPLPRQVICAQDRVARYMRKADCAIVCAGYSYFGVHSDGSCRDSCGAVVNPSAGEPMKYAFAAAAIALVLAGCSVGTARTDAPARSVVCRPIDPNEVARLFDRWNHSLQTGDAHAVVANYAERSILLPTASNKPRVTAAEKQDYFEHFLENKPSGKIDLSFIDIGCNCARDAGLCTFTFAKTGAKVAPMRGMENSG